MTSCDLSLLSRFPSLQSGSHESPDKGACVMEAVAFVAGEPWSDHPACVSPAIGAFMRNWNDSLPSDEDRDRLLRPLIPVLIGTRTNDADEQRRAFLSMDWLLREFTPTWLDLVPSLATHASALRQQREIVDVETLTAATGVCAAARDAAGDAARDAARDAAGAAAGAAAWDAAGDAAGDAARDAAWAAAWAAAGAAAGAAARDAARDALKPTTIRLQESAVGLVRRMCEVGRSS